MSKITDFSRWSRVLWISLFVLVGVTTLWLLNAHDQVWAGPAQAPPVGTRSPQTQPVPGQNAIVLTRSYLPIIIKSGSGPIPPTATSTLTPTPCTPGAQSPIDVGTEPFGIASDETDEIFVANHGSTNGNNAITILGGAQVPTSISDNRFNQPYGVAYNPVNDRIYVTNEGNGKLLLIDPTSHQVVKDLGGLDHPRGLAINRNTGDAYVASNGDGKLKKYTLADINNGTEGTFVSITSPNNVAIDSQGRVFVTNGAKLFMVTGTTSDYVLPGAYGLAYNPTNQRLYVTSGEGSELIVFDASGAGFPVPSPALKTSPDQYNLEAVAVNPNSNLVYVAGKWRNPSTQVWSIKLWVLNGSTNAWDTSYSMGSSSDSVFRQLAGVFVEPLWKKVYASNPYDNRVYPFGDCTVLPTPTPCVPKQVGAPVAVGADPYGVAADGAGRMFVANYGGHSLSVLQGTQVVATIPLPADPMNPANQAGPYGVAYNPMNNRIYVTDEAIGRLFIVNPASLSIAKVLGGLAHPRGVAIDLNTGDAYVASNGDGRVKKYTLSDVTQGLEGTPIDVGGFPTGVAVDGQSRVYATTDTDLLIIRGTNSTKQGLPGGFGVAYDPVSQKLYTASSATLTQWNIPGNYYDDPVPNIQAKTSPEYTLDSVAVSPGGRVFVTGRRDQIGKLWVFSGSGFLGVNFTISSYDENARFRGIGINSSGYVYVSSEFLDKVYIFNDNGSPVCP